MAQTLILNTVVFPLLLGTILAALIHFSSLKAGFLTLAATSAVLLVYYLLEGLPAFPPISSKHKIAYLFAIIGIVGAAIVSRHKIPLPLIAIVLGLIALGWIGQRKISADPLQVKVLLALLPVLGLGLASAAPRAHRADLFLWPSALLSLAIGGSLVSLLGGYIGLGQMLGAIAALTGGYLAVSYIWTQLLGRDVADLKVEGVNWLLLAATSVILVSIALFASKLNPLAFIVVCLVYATPFFAARYIGRTQWHTPFIMGFFSFVPALVAIGIAALNAA